MSPHAIAAVSTIVLLVLGFALGLALSVIGVGLGAAIAVLFPVDDA